MKKMKRVPTGIAILVVLCCGGALIAGMFGDDKPKTTAAPAVPALPTFAAPTRELSPSPSPSPSPVSLQMPSVTGQNAAVAQDTLKRAGFTNIQLGSADPDDKIVILAQNWKVLEQSAKAGETIPSDTLIVLTCTKKR